MFIRYISHEIRNPLNNVMLGLDHLEEVMSREAGCASKVEVVREIRDGCKSCMVTLNDMLTSDKIRSGFLVLEKRSVNVIEWLLLVVETFRVQVRREKVMYLCMYPRVVTLNLFTYEGLPIGYRSVLA